MSHLRMTPGYALCLAVASCQTIPTAKPCDVLVDLSPLPATANYIVTNDKPFARGTARIRGYYNEFNCAEEKKSDGSNSS